MSTLRRIKAQLGMYRKYKNNIRTDNFYEFILDAEKVKMDLEEHNFKLMLKFKPYCNYTEFLTIG